MTQEQCERAAKALRSKGFNASHVQGAPDDHGVWLDSVWDDAMQESYSFRIHEEEIEWWGAETTDT
jgi:hypothetical protein